MDLDDVAAELYGLPPEEFIATRAAREKQAKDAGDKQLATRIRALAKPNQVAWLANQLARQKADEIGQLIELGAALREATATLSGERLRELSRQQHQVIHALVLQARDLAGTTGRRISDDTSRGLEDTLHAALADERAARQLIAGRLTTGLRSTGFGDGAGASGNQRPAPHSTATPRDTGGASSTQRSDALARAEQDLAAAAEVDRDASHRRDRAQHEATAAEERADAATAQAERLRAELREASDAQAQAERDQRSAHTALGRADRAARVAGQRLADAAERRDRLAGQQKDGSA